MRLLTSGLCLSLQFKCCGSNSSADWQHSAYILSPEAGGRRVPDSCCKTVVARCGHRAHPSNIYKVEVSPGLRLGGQRAQLPSGGPQKAGSGQTGGRSGAHFITGQKSVVLGLQRATQRRGRTPATERFQDITA